MTTINSVSTIFYNTSHSNLNWVPASKKEGSLKTISSKISALEAFSSFCKTQINNTTVIQNSTYYTIDLAPFIASKIHITSLIFNCQQAKIILATIPAEQKNLTFKIVDPRILELLPEDYSFALLNNESSIEYQCSMLKIVDQTCFSKSNPIQSHIDHLSFDNYLEETYQQIGAFKKENAPDGKSMTLTGKRKYLCSPTYPIGTVLNSNSHYFLHIHSITEFPTSISFSIQDSLGTISKVTYAPSEFTNPNGITFQIKIPEVVAGNSTLILNLDSQKYTFPTRMCTESDIRTHWHNIFTEKYRNIFASTQNTHQTESCKPLKESFKRKTKDDIQEAIVEETKCEETKTSTKKTKAKQLNTDIPLFNNSALSKNSTEIIHLTDEKENYTTTTSENTYKEDSFTTTSSNTSQENGLNIAALSSSKVEDLELLFPDLPTIFTPTQNNDS